MNPAPRVCAGTAGLQARPSHAPGWGPAISQSSGASSRKQEQQNPLRSPCSAPVDGAESQGRETKVHHPNCRPLPTQSCTLPENRELLGSRTKGAEKQPLPPGLAEIQRDKTDAVPETPPAVTRKETCLGRGKEKHQHSILPPPAEHRVFTCLRARKPPLGWTVWSLPRGCH